MVLWFRVSTLIAGAALAAVAPLLFARLRGWERWSLTWLAWTWGWARFAHSWADVYADLGARLMTYAYIAAVPAAFIAAAAVCLRGRPRRSVLWVGLAATAAMEAWYVADHDAFLGLGNALLDLYLPTLLLALACVGLAFLDQATRRPDDALRVWVGTAFLAVPAFRAAQIILGLIILGPVTRATASVETWLYAAVLVALAVALPPLDLRRSIKPAWIVVIVSILLGIAMASWFGFVRSLEPIVWVLVLDAAMTVAVVVGLAWYAVRRPDMDALPAAPERTAATAQGP